MDIDSVEITDMPYFLMVIAPNAALLLRKEDSDNFILACAGIEVNSKNKLLKYICIL